MLNNNINDFIFRFNDFKTTDSWINKPWDIPKNLSKENFPSVKQKRKKCKIKKVHQEKLIT